MYLLYGIVLCVFIIAFVELHILLLYSWLPFIYSPPIILQVLHRLFPFARGIYEVCMYICTHVWKYICTHVCMYVCMYVRTYVRTYVCMHAYIIILSQDKVANFWCSLSVLIKLKNIFSVPVLAQIRFVRCLSVCLFVHLTQFLHPLSLLITFISLLPSAINLLRYPSPYRFLLSLVT